ncbi:MAG: ankyrin repeat domain-containing protein [Thermoanaerobaculia bacterium]
MPESLRDAVKVSSRRNYAAIGFNDPSVTVWLPMATNSIYSSFEFDKPKVTDSRGRDVAFEIEQGIFDFDTSANEIRFTKKGGTIDFAHAVGKVTVKYPLVVKTISYKKGTSGDVTIDGPFVSYNSGAVTLPEEATFSKIRSLRAYDAQGRQLERSDSRSSTLKGDVSWTQLAFWGTVAAVQIDRVEKWGTLTVDYDLASPPKLSLAQQGLQPALEERMKAASSGGGKVTKTVVVETPKAAKPSPSPASSDSSTSSSSSSSESSDDDKPLTPAEAKRKLAKMNIDATGAMLVMKAVGGHMGTVRLLLAAGVPIDSRSVGQTALIAAIRGRYRKLTPMLIDAGANVNAADDNNATPLYFAAERCTWTDIVKSLLKHGAKTDPKTRGGSTALQSAEWAGCTENAKLISGK